MAGDTYPRKRGRPPEDGERVSVFRNVAMCRLSGYHFLDRDERRRVYQTRTAECKRENVPFVKNLLFCQNRLQALKNAPRNAPSLRVVDASSNSRRTRHAPFCPESARTGLPADTRRGKMPLPWRSSPRISRAHSLGADDHRIATDWPRPHHRRFHRRQNAHHTPRPVSIVPSPVELLGSMRFRSTAVRRGGRGWRVMGNWRTAGG